VCDRDVHRAIGERPENHFIAWRNDVYLYATAIGHSQ
jgi:hypothetical protein